MKDLQKQLWKTHCAKGWNELKRSPAEEAALVHCEVSEAVEAIRTRGVNDWTVEGKPEGYFFELADAVIRIMNIFSDYDRDLEEYIQRKDRFNQTRPELHGGKKL